MIQYTRYGIETETAWVWKSGDILLMNLNSVHRDFHVVGKKKLENRLYAIVEPYAGITINLTSKRKEKKDAYHYQWKSDLLDLRKEVETKVRVVAARIPTLQEMLSVLLFGRSTSRPLHQQQGTQKACRC